MKINPTQIINELISALTFIIDVEEKKKIYHAGRVAILSYQFAQDKAGKEKLKAIFYAALLHDIAGVGFSHHIIHYLKRHDKISRNILLSHPIIGAQLISNIPQMTSVAKLILDHHEWVNGKGYPRGKTGRYISWGAQIIRLADSIDIGLQASRLPKLSELKNKISLNVDKEYPKALFKRAFGILKNKFFYSISARRNIPIIFQEIKNKLGSIHIPLKIDAVGTALEVFAQIIDMKHPYTSGHSLRVSRYAMTCALVMNLGHDEITQIKWAGLIHDIGKLALARSILDKPTNLTFREFQEVKKHAIITRKIMEMIPTLKEIAPIASAHHEHFDGSGYPLGLRGLEIPLGARILAICDAFDAMISNRPYRRPLTPEDACKEIEKRCNSQFDPDLVKELLPLFKHLSL